MRINNLECSGFRNLAPLQIEPSPGINVIYGENAQGKTNLLESIWMCSGMKSFRGAKDAELKGFDTQCAKVRLCYTDLRREHTAELRIAERRSASLNGVSLPSAAGLIGKFRAVVFSPAFLSIVQNGPAERRRFIDAAVCQLKPAYAQKLADYSRLLRQRNSLLKDIQMETALLDMLDVIDLQMSALAAEITAERTDYLSLLTPHADGIYSGLSGGRETLSFRYLRKSGDEGSDYQDIFKANRKTDLVLKSTTAGPHRDDVEICVNGISARLYGSQGQQRSCALTMKLAEASVVKAQTGEEPVTLLDDVMSELDTGRQDYILNHIKSRQVFITCCDPGTVLRLTEGKRFFIQNGQVECT